MIRKGDKVQIKPEWQDAGDDRFDAGGLIMTLSPKAEAYIDGVRQMLVLGDAPDVLFERLSDADCMAIASAIKADDGLQWLFRREECSGCVDTYLLAVAAAA